ncbi:MAG: dihydropteroate synthase [Desulfomonile tiedjei]|nr:dihydropteroate synthase [Desulfomonile tiedjei]
MIIVGEKINTGRPRITEAMAKRHASSILAVAREQAQAGADFIDVNAGTFLEHEADYLSWLVETIQGEVDLPLCLSTSNASALSEAMKRHRGEPMVNAISLAKERLRSFLPVITSRPCRVIALSAAEGSTPVPLDERIRASSELISILTGEGIPPEKIYIDPAVQPMVKDSGTGLATIGTIRQMVADFPEVNTICGISNVSFGLPARPFINRQFLALLMTAGLSAAILDPTDKHLMATLLAVDALLGRDASCKSFIDAYTNGRIAV